MNFSPLTIRLDHPCALDWEQLGPGEKERLCNACGKNIVDFSKFTDAELLEYFKYKPSGICGHFSETQIHRELYPGIVSRMGTIARRMLSAAMLGTGIFIPSDARAQLTEIPNAHGSPNYFIRGLIMLEGTSDPAIMAKVTLYENSMPVYSFFTDAQGRYNFEIDSNLLPAVSHVIIESSDNRVRYEEDVKKSEILSFFNRAIPFYTNLLVCTPEELPSAARSNVSKGKESSKKWNPFRKKKRYYRFRMGCPEF